MSFCRLSCRCHAQRQLAEQNRRIDPPTRSWATGLPQCGQGVIGSTCALVLLLSFILAVLHAFLGLSMKRPSPFRHLLSLALGLSLPFTPTTSIETDPYEGVNVSHPDPQQSAEANAGKPSLSDPSPQRGT